jgi:hypothetical protein
MHGMIEGVTSAPTGRSVRLYEAKVGTQTQGFHPPHSQIVQLLWWGPSMGLRTSGVDIRAKIRILEGMESRNGHHRTDT